MEETAAGTAAAASAAAVPNGSKKIRRYLLARHGETNFNKERRVQGTSDASVLTLEGISQASALGMYIAQRQAGKVSEVSDYIAKNVNTSDSSTTASSPAAVAPSITRTWCSPLTRCKQTYAAISGCCNSPNNSNSNYHNTVLPTPHIHNNLREIELCEWQGRLRQEIMNEDPDNWKDFKRDPKCLKLRGGAFAPVVDCWERGLDNWNVIRKGAAVNSNAHNKEEEGAIFIMCHGAIGQCMLLQSLGIPIDAYGKSRKYSFDNCECVEVEWADGEEDECALRWRRVHPVETGWELALASRRMASGGLSCER